MQAELFEPYDAVFFDLDGTLYDDRQYDFGAYGLIAQAFPGEPDLRSRLLELKQQRGRQYLHLFDEICRERALPIAAAGQMLAIYRGFEPVHLELDPPMARLLRQLDRQQLFLVTNGRPVTQAKKIKALALSGRFQAIYICDAVTWPLKPDIAAYEHAKRTFGFERAVMVGDSRAIDQGFALNAGIPFFYHSVIAQ